MNRLVAGEIGITAGAKSEVGDIGSLLSESDDKMIVWGSKDIVL